MKSNEFKKSLIRNNTELIMNTLKAIRSDLPEILEKMDFFTAPASAGHHGNYPGGLLEHSVCVTMELVNLTRTQKLEWARPESPLIVGMLHDLCKCDQYILTPTGYKTNPDTINLGHGDRSVEMVSKLIDLTPEEVFCIRYHMGAFVPKQQWGEYSGAVRRYPNVLWTHTADMIASQLYNT